MASPSLLSTATSKPMPPLSLLPSKPTTTSLTSNRPSIGFGRRELGLSIASGFMAMVFQPAMAALAVSDEEYAKDTAEVINKVRSTINMDKTDPNVAEAVSVLREASNTWVAKYRREKALLGRPSFRDMYSALNAVAGHYISFGPTAPIPAKRKARILEEMDTAEKALLRGR